MKITLEKEAGSGYWAIVWDRDMEGDLVCDRLGFDEALGAIAAIFLGVRPPYLEPPSVHRARMEDRLPRPFENVTIHKGSCWYCDRCNLPMGDSGCPIHGMDTTMHRSLGKP